MGVKVRERPAGSGKWWVFTDFRGKRTARYIPQGKRAAEKVAFEIATKLDLIKQTEKHGLTASPREVILGRDRGFSLSMPKPIGPLFGDYASQWLEACEARGLKASTLRSYRTIVEVHLRPSFGALHLSQIDRRTVKEFVHTKLTRADCTNTEGWTTRSRAIRPDGPPYTPGPVHALQFGHRR